MENEDVKLADFTVAEAPNLLDKPMDHFQMVMISGMAFYQYNSGTEVFYVSPDKDVFKSVEDIYKAFDIQSHAISPKTLEDTFISKKNTGTIIFEIRELLKQYIYLKNDVDYTFLALYVILTHSYRLFSRIPYLSLRGEKGSGKSTIMLVMQALAYNSFLFSNITTASLFRLIEQKSPTLFLDEAESLSEKSAANSPIIQVLNSGYQKDGKVARVEKGVMNQYSTFCPKVIAGIRPLEPATEDRCITIRMEKAPSNSNIKPSVDEAGFMKTASEVKSRIFAELNKASSKIISYYTNPSALKLDKGIKNRDLDKWLPILSIAKAFSCKGNNYFKDIEDYALKEIMKKKEVEKNLPENSCRRLIIEFIKANRNNTVKILRQDKLYYYVSAEEFFDEVAQKDVHNSYNQQADVTKVLSKISILSSRQRFKSMPVIVYKVPVSMVS